MQERRIVFTFGVAYDTPVDKVEAIPGVVRQLVQAQPVLRFDRAHFKGFGDSSLDFEVVYIVKDAAFNVYMDMQQAINLGLMRGLAGLGVEFAFPTRTIHVATLPLQAARTAQSRPVPAGASTAGEPEAVRA
jgi:small-conductance mechanosensitive channel